MSAKDLGTSSSTSSQTDIRSRPSQHASYEGINIIIPMGGIGSRFQREGYRFPKPLIKIVGRPMLCWLVENLKTTAQDTLWLAINEEVENEFQLGQSMRKWFPKLNVRVVKLNYLTKGATETLFIVAQSMPASYRRRKTISLDCDTIYFHDILTKVRQLPSGHGGCFYFEDEGNQPIFSYIVYDEANVITEIQEKKAISTHANTGAYVFPSGNALQTWSNILLDSKLDPTSKHEGEYFTSQMIEEMIKTGGVPFTALHLSKDDFSCVGTPRQLDEFLLKINRKDPAIKSKKQRFCFDLDMTLVGYPEIPGDYSTCPPIWQNIELVRALYNSGHHIIIQTARRMKTHNGNIGAVIADIGCTTMASLAKYNIPYHEIFFGKPHADIYVDDLAVNANVDTRREIGWLATDAAAEDTTQGANLLAELKHAKKAGIVPSRDFNHIQIIGERVMKSSKSPKLLAEMYFYSRMPRGIADLFPKLYATNYFPETSTYSFTMQKVEGVSYSHLLVARSLTTRRLELMLDAIHRIHTCTEPNAEPAEDVISPEVQQRLAPTTASSASRNSSDSDRSSLVSVSDTSDLDSGNSDSVNIYANYASKVASRYQQYRKTYDALGSHKTAHVYARLQASLESYEHNARATQVAYIHGDPVFSNIVLDEAARKVTFFDVRSQLGDSFTTVGDVCYDLAKILQSLQGYDHIVLTGEEALTTKSSSGADDAQAELSAILRPEDRLFLGTLQNTFWKFVRDRYGADLVEPHELLMLVASLLFSLIPLHRPAFQPLFLQMCVNILEHEVACPI